MIKEEIKVFFSSFKNSFLRRLIYLCIKQQDT